MMDCRLRNCFLCMKPFSSLMSFYFFQVNESCLSTHHSQAQNSQKAELDRTLLRSMGYLTLPLPQIPQQLNKKHSWDFCPTSHAHVAVFLRYNDGNSVRETIRNIEIITEPILTVVFCCTTFACIIRCSSWESVSMRFAEMTVAHIGNNLRRFFARSMIITQFQLCNRMIALVSPVFAAVSWLIRALV